MKVLFIGGTGQISLACVTRTLEAGHQVTVFNRGNANARLPAGVTSIVGDLNDDTAYARLGGNGYDIVCQFMAFTPDRINRDIATFAGKVGHYIFISSASVYEKPARHYVITEKTPAVNPFWQYSKNKIACEKLLARSENLVWTIVRPSHTVRLGLPVLVGEGDRLGHRLLAGKPVLVSGDGSAPWTLTRAVDFAVPFVNLFGKPDAHGEIFHITQDMGYTWDAIYHALARGLGVDADIVHVPADNLVRYNPDWTGPLFGDKAWTALFDNSKVKAVAGNFTCETDLDRVLETSITDFKSRVAAGTPKPDATDLLMDRIAAEQRLLGNR